MKAGIGGGGRASDRHLEAEAALHQHRPLRRRDAAVAAAAAAAADPESRPKPGEYAREGRAIDGFLLSCGSILASY